MKNSCYVSFLFIVFAPMYGTLSHDSQKGVSWANSKLIVQASSLNESGVFTKEKISKDEPLAVFGGIIMQKDDVLQLPDQFRRYVLQIADDLWIASGLSIPEIADLINHSCDPNAGIKGQILLAAMRDIEPGEEITFDYATVISEWVGMEPIQCTCGSAICRKIIMHDYWKKPELQAKYQGYFSEYLEKKIKSENAAADTKYALEKYLTDELDDAILAKKLSTILIEDILNWRVPTVATAEITSIVAFAFGNRILPNGNRLPGPMNEALADLAVQLYQETLAPVYAQWEISQAIGDRIPSEKLIVINPTLDAQANIVYLSTAGVASAIIKHVSDSQKLGKVAVVAFHDHLYRCIQLSRDAGIDAYAPEGYAMPNKYDELSGQSWTRDRLTYLVTDIKARITNQFEKLIKQIK